MLIDTEDLEKVKSFKNSWGATKVKEKRWLIKGTYRENKVKKNITLIIFILNITDNSLVRFINKDQLDHRKSNLTVGYEAVQITKGNDYKIDGNKAYLVLNRREETPLTSQIDVEDLQRVLGKGTWFAEWHSGFDNYLVQNVSYYYEDGKKHRKKITLHSFIMGITDKSSINHVDGDTLNNCKANLKVYSKEMLNDYEEMENGAVAIILIDEYGKEKGRAIIDKEDLSRVRSNGYRWFYYQGNGYPYAIANISGKRVYLHRLIMLHQKEWL